MTVVMAVYKIFTLFAAFSPNVTMTVVYFDDGCLFHVKFHGIPRGRFVDISWTFVKPNSGLIRVLCRFVVFLRGFTPTEFGFDSGFSGLG